MQANASQTGLTLVSWNIQVGSDEKLSGNNWPSRKKALVAVLSREAPDIVCLQEATLTQLQYLMGELPVYDRVGVGRDDGANNGEHCAILYRKSRLVALKSGTFWLSDTPDTCKSTWDGVYKRICTWAFFRDQNTHSEFCVFNTHFPLNPFAHGKSARLVIKRANELCPDKYGFVVGDFNSTPQSAAWSVIKQAGYNDSELAAGKSSTSNTCQVFGHGIARIDAIFVSPKIRISEHRLLDDKINGIYPSDHFGTFVRAEMNRN
jgi:endonuclease/exonuclease/phosphatase family metal-dependent hydrolase